MSDNLKIQILMPMGGLGQRFVEAGYDTPKPMIEIEGKPMFMKALESFPQNWEMQNIFVIRQDQDQKYNLKQQIESTLPTAQVEILDHNTGGAVETCLIAEQDIDDDLPIIIADCDTRFKSLEYNKKVEKNQVDGLLLSFNSDDPRYSYAKLDDNGKVIETAEKVVISNHALLGGYYIKSGKLFKEIAHQFVDNPLPQNLKEYFMSHLYNILLEKGKRVEIADADGFDIWGTPEELKAYFDKN
ncbi:MAG: glycosyltransferase family 2 protein [Candidatus Ancillula sp.]|nr:glycosyltransferase family 2 protein [Candidatus Ancillula sp.]